MTLRDHLTESKAWAHAVLDDVRDGYPQRDADVRLALQLLGEPV
ncbi:hypothetical protein SAMN04489708_11054 [Paracidovorax cattleyae]|uniref:Uncharacterized protein n=1 Tax=Paracidovorax cattleyae TaxID=80868 RepID=A0A1H0RGD3_9BURK|nr:hypothetical protein SAMN04489708_11054 [Paracidovorax cattleyae]